MGINAAAIGGIMLIIGNIFVFKGEVYNSIRMFLLADFAWLWMAIQAGNLFGIVTLAIGLILSFFAFWKMRQGIFHKEIKKSKK